MTATGSLQSLVKGIAKWAKTVRKGQFTAWLMGLVIFFDDYANTLLVGNSMRPFTDSLKISREKLAYIVDSTAAPVASIVPISTWIGYEVGLLGAALAAIDVGSDPYGVFLQSIPYRFYGLLAVVFVLLVALFNRDFSHMYLAETRARQTGKVLAEKAKPLVETESFVQFPRREATAFEALLPILLVVLVIVFGLYLSGLKALKLEGSTVAEQPTLREIIGKADSFQVLMWAAFAGSFAAFALSLRSLSVSEAMDEYLKGIKAMVPAMVILVLAWSLGTVCEKLQTGKFCIGIATGRIPASLLPALVFLLAAFVSFATGTSWATMGILVPIVIPLSWRLTENLHFSEAIRLASIGAVLSGATFGDHCSPISDTTIMSSMGSGCDHIDHVRTQIPYAFTVAAISTLLGYLPAGFGFSPFLGLILALAALSALLVVAGRTPDFTH